VAPASATTAFPAASAAVLAPSVLQDVQRALQQLGVQTLRVSVLDTRTLEFDWAQSITEHGELQEGDTQRPLDSVFPGGSATVASITRRASTDISMQKHSPRRWLLAWRLDGAADAPGALPADEHKASLVDVLFHDKRDLLSDADAALLRLISHASMAARVGSDAERAAASTGTLVWPQVERRASPPVTQGESWAPAVALASVLAAVLLAAWLALWVVPNVKKDAAARQTDFVALRDGTMGRSLSAALATGDYGEVQAALQTCAELGHFQSAVVVNDKQRVVAVAGTVKNQRIGESVAAAFKDSASSLKLTTGSQQQGQLLFVAAPASDAGQTHLPLVWASALVACFGAASALLQLRGWRRHRV
jgi:hypothetical protein